MKETDIKEIEDKLNFVRKSAMLNMKSIMVHENPLDNFSDNFRDKLNSSVLHNTIYHSLLNGQSPYSTIEQLLNIIENLNESYQEVLKNSTPIIKMSQEEFEKVHIKIMNMSQYGTFGKPEEFNNIID